MSTDELQLRTASFAHQAEEWRAHRDDLSRALFWEQGTGKTKAAIDAAAWLYHGRKIDGMLVVAPNGIHQNWVSDELPKHCPIPYVAHAWSTKRARTRTHDEEVNAVVTHGGGRLRILAMSYDALMTGPGSEAVKEFLDRRTRSCMYILDESHRIKTPGTKRTIRAIASGRHARYRYILSGTPVTNKPFDVYSQLRFLDPDFWPKHGFASYEAFKTFFGIWEDRIAGHSGQRFKQLISYQNIGRLHAIVAGISSRVLKDEVLDLPPRLYKKVYFELTPEQRTAYEDLRDRLLHEVDDHRGATAPLMVTRLLRFQQVACGYLPCDPENVRQATGHEDVPVHRFGKNPRLTALLDLLEDIEGSVLVFCRFQEDVEQIQASLGEDCAVHYGPTSPEDRAIARERFQAGDVRFLVGTAATMGAGFTLHKARTVVYYSNSYSLEHRLQSEARAHRIGQVAPVLYIDLVARGTVDERIVDALREKREVAAEVTGDTLKDWI